MNTPTPSCFELSCTECDARTAALTAERDQLRAELADQTTRFHDEIVSRQGTVRNNHELNLKERDHLLDQLAKERARLDWLEQRGPWDAWIKPPEEGLTLRAPIRAAIDSAMKEGA